MRKTETPRAWVGHVWVVGKWQRRDPSPGSQGVLTVLIITLLCRKSNVESYEKVLILTEALFQLLSGFRYQTLQCYQTARPGAPTPLFPRVVLTKPRCLNTDLLPQSSGD